MPVGRSKNADPKWLVPLICRLGHVTKKDIGLIKIFDNETKFEITREAEPRFREAIKAAGDSGDIRINPAGAPGATPPRAAGPRPDRVPRPDGPRPPYAPRPQGSGPHQGDRQSRGPRPGAGGPPKKPFKKRAPNG